MQRLLFRLVAPALIALTLAAVPATASGAPLRWHACGSHGAQCSSLQVPLDYDVPGGTQISVGLTKHDPATPARSLGVLFFNPGGPGGQTRDIVRDQAASFFPKALLDRFEIVGVDPRGVSPGRPAVRCGLPTRDRRITVAPTSREGYAKLRAYSKRVGRSCLKHTGAALLRNVDTVSTARDLDVARAALGADRISWLGVSYGSLLGQTYAQLFPTRVRAAVLDGALDHSVGPTRLALDEAREAEEALALFSRWCDRTRRCALHGRDVRSTYRALLAHARRRPIPARGVPGGATADQIGYGVFVFMEVPAQWPLLAKALASATDRHPDASLLAKVGAPEGGAYRATTCADLPSDISTYSQYRKLLTKLRAAAPDFGPYVEGLAVVAGCLGWPVPSRNPWGAVPVTGTPPLLVVSGAHDVSTPDSWGVGMAHQIAGSRLLRWDGPGHTAYANDPRIREREVRYLLSPDAPVPGSTGAGG